MERSRRLVEVEELRFFFVSRIGLDTESTNLGPWEGRAVGAEELRFSVSRIGLDTEPTTLGSRGGVGEW